MCVVGCEDSSNAVMYQELGEYIESLIFDAKSVTQRRGALLPSLYKAQELFGYLLEEVLEFLAEKLDIHLSEIFGVVSFYSYFTMRPQGKFRISVCTGTACYIKGADKLIKCFSDELGIDDGEVTNNLSHSLDTLRCVGACGLAPVVLVNDKVYGNVTPEMIPMILRECEEK